MDLALEVSPFFRLKHQKAKEIIKQIEDATSNWRKIANEYKIGKNEQERMYRAFKQK